MTVAGRPQPQASPRPRPTRGIETLYGGYTMRSRNEARWAAMFDELGWEWEYEPFDANGYIPDFVLTGALPVLVEVKPDLNLEELGEHKRKVVRGLAGLWDHDVLIVGSLPVPYLHPDRRDWAHPVIGVLMEPAEDESGPTWQHGPGHWCTCTECGRPSFFHSHLHYAARLCGHYDGGRNLGIFELLAIKRRWAAAADKVRWQPQ